MKRFTMMMVMLLMIFMLAACSSDSKTSTTATTTSKKNGEVEMVFSGEHGMVDGFSPQAKLVKGKAELTLETWDEEEMHVSIMPKADATGRSTSLIVVSNDKKKMKKTVEIPENGYYDISYASKDYDGKWKVTITQKQNKGDFPHQLTLAHYEEKVGGEYEPSIDPIHHTGSKEGYGSAINEMFVNENGVAFEVWDTETKQAFISELKNEKWIKIEKPREDSLSQYQIYKEAHSDFEDIAYINSSLGTITIASYDGGYHILPTDKSIEPINISMNAELLELFEEEETYYDHNSESLIVVEHEKDSEGNDVVSLLKYDIKKEKFLTDQEGEPKKIALPDIEWTTHLDIDSYDKTFYIVSYGGSSATVYAYNDQLVPLSQPLEVSTLYYGGEGKVAIGATPTGIDIWNIYDARIINGNDFNKPYFAGANHFQLQLNPDGKSITSNSDDKNSKDEKEEKPKEKSQPSEDATQPETDTSIASDSASQSDNQASEETNNGNTKAKYLAKLEQTESQEKHNEYQNDYQMTEDYGYNYKLWDTLLNEMYQVLKTQLTETEMSKLKAEQLEWIDYKEAAAQTAYDESGGGTLSSMVRMERLFTLTKERCYKLIEYM